MAVSGAIRSICPNMQVLSSRLFGWPRGRHPFKNSNDYIDIEHVLASFADPDEPPNGAWPPGTINLSVVASRYNMLD
ncbi:hypothetical protein [Bradyrhizobium cosmicum]|uniref:hypothetical protein n=1 Tax=Bradyrhizobium cosmicum TaxID=1404864 RepID=UPI0028F08883|nr:hypothetical protein [Bradyrhizobium cosmicum]